MISITATGDSFITRRLPANNDAARQLRELIGSADVRFTNLEQCCAVMKDSFRAKWRNVGKFPAGSAE